MARSKADRQRAKQGYFRYVEGDREGYQEKAGKNREAFVSADAEVCRLASKIEGVRESSEGRTKVNCKDAH